MSTSVPLPPPKPHRARRLRAVFLCLAFGALALGACGGNSSSSSSGGDDAKVTAPEDVKAPLADVQAKLPGIIQLGGEARDGANAGRWDVAKSSFDDLMSIWFEVEGTVGDLDRNAYEAIETAQGLISDGIESRNAARVATGATNQQSSIQKFVDAHQ